MVQSQKKNLGPETCRDVAFCSHAILQPDRMLYVNDTLKDPRFANNPLVTGAPHIRFYAGMPVSVGTPCGPIAIGTLCVIDSSMKELSLLQKMALQSLSILVQQCLLLRNKMKTLSMDEMMKSIAQNMPPEFHFSKDNPLLGPSSPKPEKDPKTKLPVATTTTSHDEKSDTVKSKSCVCTSVEMKTIGEIHSNPVNSFHKVVVVGQLQYIGPLDGMPELTRARIKLPFGECVFSTSRPIFKPGR